MSITVAEFAKDYTVGVLQFHDAGDSVAHATKIFS